jgi:hypothetical protein
MGETLTIYNVRLAGLTHATLPLRNARCSVLALPKNLSPVAVPYNIDDSNGTKTLVFRGKSHHVGWLKTYSKTAQIVCSCHYYTGSRPIAFLNLSNLILSSAFVKPSATWFSVLTYSSCIVPSLTFPPRNSVAYRYVSFKRGTGVLCQSYGAFVVTIYNRSSRLGSSLGLHFVEESA